MADRRESPVRRTSSSWSRLDTLPDGAAELLSSQEVAVGAVIGERYKILSSLGDGAMGNVFVAENLAIGLQVAVKLLKPDLLAKSEFRRRFQQEAQAIAA